MTAVRHSAAEDRGDLPRTASRWPLLAAPRPLLVYVSFLGLLHAGLIVAGLARAALASTGFLATSFEPVDLLAFVALLGCGAVCIEATRRLGMPAGVGRDLLSAWWLPGALLLPPIYALLMPIPLQVLQQFRVRRTLIHRRVVVSAALALAGAAASAVFHVWVKDPLNDPDGWTRDRWTILLAIGCAVLFTVVNTGIVAVAAHSAAPDTRWREVLWNRESLMLDLVELCVGVLVTICCTVSLGLLVLALPPVMLLQRSLMHQQLQAAARTDAKTGLLNAGAWQREADTELARARRSSEPLALLLVDLDHFKRVNDTYGHLVGDQVLLAVATTLVNQLREYDVVGRFGGEEFAVLLPGADTVEACRVAERLRNRVRRLVVPAEDGNVNVTISVGVALFRTHGDDMIELLAAADLALYRAKESGRDRVCLPASTGPRPGPAS